MKKLLQDLKDNMLEIMSIDRCCEKMGLLKELMFFVFLLQHLQSMEVVLK